jgi:ABC-type protease/lipase transport system fused ATPase/permease subunit
MAMLANILSFTSGFVLMGYQLPPATMIATSIVVDLALAPLTAVIASRRGRSAAVWTVAGLAFGMWALAAVLLLRPSTASTPTRPNPPDYPSTSDAA